MDLITQAHTRVFQLCLGLVGLVLCCETGLATLVVIMILKDTATFQVLFIVSLFWSWNITTVEINSGIYLLKSLICHVPLFICQWSWVLLFWSWSCC